MTSARISLRSYSLPFMAALVVSCSDTSPTPPLQQANKTTSLSTLVVETARVGREASYDGVVESVNQSTVAAQTSGRLVELPYDVGDFVEKDAVIARLTGTEQRARSGAAEAGLAEARARLAEAQLTYDRTRDVYAKQAVAKSQLDKAAADLDSARARLDSAQAALTEAREGLEYTVIRAPYAGIVVERHVQLGETVEPGKPLLTGVSLEHLRVAADIPQQHIGPLRKHLKARVLFPDGTSVDGTEIRLPPNADPATHTFRVLITLPPGNYNVFPGTLVKVAFVSGEEEHLLLPEQSIVRRGEITGVYVLDEKNIVTMRYLRLGTPTSDGRVPVLAGIVAGERVALDPIAAGIASKQIAAENKGE